MPIRFTGEGVQASLRLTLQNCRLHISEFKLRSETTKGPFLTAEYAEYAERTEAKYEEMASEWGQTNEGGKIIISLVDVFGGME